MSCSSENRFFMSNLLRVGDWTPNRSAAQTWGGVDLHQSTWGCSVPRPGESAHAPLLVRIREPVEELGHRSPVAHCIAVQWHIQFPGNGHRVPYLFLGWGLEIPIEALHDGRRNPRGQTLAQGAAVSIRSRAIEPQTPRFKRAVIQR